MKPFMNMNDDDLLNPLSPSNPLRDTLPSLSLSPNLALAPTMGPPAPVSCAVPTVAKRMVMDMVVIIPSAAIHMIDDRHAYTTKPPPPSAHKQRMMMAAVKRAEADAERREAEADDEGEGEGEVVVGGGGDLVMRVRQLVRYKQRVMKAQLLVTSTHNGAHNGEAGGGGGGGGGSGSDGRPMLTESVVFGGATATSGDGSVDTMAAASTYSSVVVPSWLCATFTDARLRLQQRPPHKPQYGHGHGHGHGHGYGHGDVEVELDDQNEVRGDYDRQYMTGLLWVVMWCTVVPVMHA